MYCLYKFHFYGGVHIGGGALWDSLNTIHADTLFSALCIEAVRANGGGAASELAECVKAGELKLSDMFPFIKDNYYLPKPAIQIKRETDGDSVVKKSFKKLKYVPASEFKTYLNGELNPVKAALELDSLGKSSIRTMSALRNEDRGEALPFSVGVYNFNKGNGLYLIAAYSNGSVKDKVEELLKSLSYSGIGGKKSAGLGRFELEQKEANADIIERLESGGRSMTLSVCMAAPDRLETVLEGATYILIKRSGFIDSDNQQRPLRKRDFYSFNAGSCFNEPFAGDVFNVAPAGRTAYRYAAPLWLGIER